MNLLGFNIAWLCGLYQHKHKRKAVSSKEQQRNRMGMAGCSANLQFTNSASLLISPVLIFLRYLGIITDAYRCLLIAFSLMKILHFIINICLVISPD